jgi:hypothetical protein
MSRKTEAELGQSLIYVHLFVADTNACVFSYEVTQGESSKGRTGKYESKPGELHGILKWKLRWLQFKTHC